jgi:hypothetical protein
MLSWREKLVMTLAPGFFPGVTIGDWLWLLKDNGFAIAPPYWLRAASTTLHSLLNSPLRCYEEWVHGWKFRSVSVPAPLFVLGHWRSGTTHLHNLLSVDARFAYPNLYQVSFPHTFLTTEWIVARIGDFFLPVTRMGVDNVRLDFGVPYEDEFATAAATFCSSYLSWAFPRREDHYDRYLTFRGVAAAEIEQWKAALLAFLRKLTWKHGRPLVLKSPPSTCRIRLLLELFPEARFVHIHRNPHVVFRSTRHMTEAAQRYYLFQHADQTRLDDRILRQYREMYDVFFEERGLIPCNHFTEVRFEDLEQDPVGQVRNIYQALDLPDFAVVEPALRQYVAGLAGYQKNVFGDLPGDLRQRIAEQWRRCFEEWNYPV